MKPKSQASRDWRARPPVMPEARDAKVAPKSLERHTRWRQERPKGGQKEHQMAPRGAQGRAKEHQMPPRGAQGSPKGHHRIKARPSFAAVLAENGEKHMVIATSRVTGGHARRVANQAEIKPSVKGGGLPHK